MSTKIDQIVEDFHGTSIFPPSAQLQESPVSVKAQKCFLDYRTIYTPQEFINTILMKGN